MTRQLLQQLRPDEIQELVNKYKLDFELYGYDTNRWKSVTYDQIKQEGRSENDDDGWCQPSAQSALQPVAVHCSFYPCSHQSVRQKRRHSKQRKMRWLRKKINDLTVSNYLSPHQCNGCNSGYIFWVTNQINATIKKHPKFLSPSFVMMYGFSVRDLTNSKTFTTCDKNWTMIIVKLMRGMKHNISHWTCATLGYIWTLNCLDS